jgi:putative transposase
VQLYKDQFYHLYNRSINNERLFHSENHYLFFLKKFEKILKYVDILAFCLMPTHFHFLIRVLTEDQKLLQRSIGDVLGGYSRAINKERNRTGSLFQQHTKAKLLKSEKHLIALLHYIHQNPLHSKIVINIRDWKYSSYIDYIEDKDRYFALDKQLLQRFKNIDEFIKDSNDIPQ